MDIRQRLEETISLNSVNDSPTRDCKWSPSAKLGVPKPCFYWRPTLIRIWRVSSRTEGYEDASPMGDNSEYEHVCRRSVLRMTAGLSTIGALTGCMGGDGDGGGNGDGETPTATQTPTGMATEGSQEITMGAPKVAAAGVSPRVARDQDFTTERNLNLELQLGAPPEIFTKFQGKKLESSTFPVISAARLANQGAAVRLVQPHARSFNSIIVRKGSGPSNVTDLQDVKLGSMPQKTAPFTHFALLLKLQGYNVDNYNFQFGPPPVLFGQMKQGKIDAMIGVEPFSTRLLATGNYKEFFVFNEEWNALKGTNMPLVEVATYRDVLNKNSTALKVLTEALIDAGQYISENPKQVFQKYSDVLGLQNQEEIQLATERIASIYPAEFATELRESGKEIVRLAAEKGLIEEKPPINKMFVSPDEQ